jgi:hypothetical protein
MSVLERPHFVIKPIDLAQWLELEPDTWWIVDGDPRLMGKLDLPCPGEELAEALRSYHKDLFVYPIGPAPVEPEPKGQPIEWERLGELLDREGPEGRRTFLLSWSDLQDGWLLVEYPSWKLDDDER